MISAADGLIGVAALAGDLRGQVVVLVPAAMEELDEPHAALGQPAGQQAVGGDRSRACATSGPYSSRTDRRLVGEVGQLGDRRLHPVGQLVLGDPREDLGIAELAMLERVRAAPGRRACAAAAARREPGRIREVEHRVADRRGT